MSQSPGLVTLPFLFSHELLLQFCGLNIIRVNVILLEGLVLSCLDELELLYGLHSFVDGEVDGRDGDAGEAHPFEALGRPLRNFAIYFQLHLRFKYLNEID